MQHNNIEIIALISTLLLKNFVFIEVLSTFIIIVYSHGPLYMQIVLQNWIESCILVLVCNNDAHTREPLT